jgi:hypothetical protein
MKIIATGIAALLFTCGMTAQNKNVTQTSKTTVTTVKDSEGEKKLVRTQSTNEVQNIQLQDEQSNKLNKDVAPSPVQVTSTTQITAPDGTTRTVDVDRSAYYSFGDRKYKVAVDNTGYTMMDNDQKAGVLRKLPNDTYIYKSKDGTSVGYFDADGNLILNTYDDKTDNVRTEIYKRNQ